MTPWKTGCCVGSQPCDELTKELVHHHCPSKTLMIGYQIVGVKYAVIIILDYSLDMLGLCLI